MKAYATNEVGTGYGSQLPFTTGAILLATLTTTNVTSVTKTSAISGGNITSDGGGTITARGVCWSTNQNPTTSDSKTTDGSGTGSFTSNITGLSAGKTYNVRAYAINSAGTSYANDQNFDTPPEGIGGIIFNPSLTYGTVKDIEDNTYKTIQINTQIWMAENLKTTKYNDGIEIPNVTDNTAWGNKTTGAYCWYNNDIANKTTYGALYNWHAVNTSHLCPTDWHVPSDDEWKLLEIYLGMSQTEADSYYHRGTHNEGGKLKETGTTHWNAPNTSATNESGFTALPGGIRGTNNMGLESCWWCSSHYSHDNSYIRIIDSQINSICRGDQPDNASSSVRCVKN